MENTCLMLMTSLWTPIDLDFVIDPSDLAKDGIEKDPHVTVFYANDQTVQKTTILEDIKEFLGELNNTSLLEFLKSDMTFPVYDVFGLDKFERPEFDVLVMRLKPESKISEILSKINQGFTDKYGLKSDFDAYRPHMTLSYLRSGTADRYLSDVTLDKVLRDTKVSWDDLCISYGPKEGPYKQWFLTQYNCIPRHLRQERLQKGVLSVPED